LDLSLLPVLKRRAGIVKQFRKFKIGILRDLEHLRGHCGELQSRKKGDALTMVKSLVQIYSSHPICYLRMKKGMKNFVSLWALITMVQTFVFEEMEKKLV